MRITLNFPLLVLTTCTLAFFSTSLYAEQEQTADPAIEETPIANSKPTAPAQAPKDEPNSGTSDDTSNDLNNEPLGSGDAQDLEKSQGDAPEPSTGMTFSSLVAIVGRYTGDVETQGSSLTFSFNDVPMTLIADERANRMRIITPILDADQLSPEQMLAISLANFHLALDARYALGGNMLYSTYIHPLKELTAGQVESAIRQVSSLRITFGTTYTSGEMTFGGSRPSGQEI